MSTGNHIELELDDLARLGFVREVTEEGRRVVRFAPPFADVSFVVGSRTMPVTVATRLMQAVAYFRSLS